MPEWFVNGFEHYVYKAYDSMGCLLYVGLTYDLRVRMRNHAKSSLWWNEHVYMEYAVYRDRQSATADERKAILTEYPIYNIQKTPNLPSNPS